LQLSHDQFAIAEDDDLARPQLTGKAQPFQDRLILRLVVGGGRQRSLTGRNDLPLLIASDDPDACQTWVALRRTVHIDRQDHQSHRPLPASAHHNLATLRPPMAKRGGWCVKILAALGDGVSLRAHQQG
jgi:hypothetical protein